MNDQQPEELVDPSQGAPARETPDDDGAGGTGNAPDLDEDESPKEGNSPGPRFPTASDSPLLEMSGGASVARVSIQPALNGFRRK
jgi:hypothetical protein